MKKIYLFIIPVLFLFACKKENQGPSPEDRIKELGLKMGSSYTEVYARLQQIKEMDGLSNVEVVDLKTFSRPEELQHSFGLYRRLALVANPLTSVHISFKDDKVDNIDVQDAKKSSWSDQWPANVANEIAIHKNDKLDEVYTKLLAIYQLPAYKEYKLYTLDKSYAKPFDPNMANYNEWLFWISRHVGPLVEGRSSVRLIFKNGKLNDVVHKYDELQLVN